MDLNARTMAASRLVTSGDLEGAIAEARSILVDPLADHPVVLMNCAGILIDAGERLDNQATVLEGLVIFQRLRSAAGLSARAQIQLLYGFANAKASILQMDARRHGPPDEQVRVMHPEEDVVALYYDSTDSLRNAAPETIINCASILRLQGRVYEAIDLLDYVLTQNPRHPNAHMKMAEMLYFTFWSVRGRDAAIEALLLPALNHYDQAITEFEATGQPDFAMDARSGQTTLREAVTRFLRADEHGQLPDHCSEKSKVERVGSPLGLTHLARSPYLLHDDPKLLEHVRQSLRDLVADAAGTFVVGRWLLQQSAAARPLMPAWHAHAPDATEHLQNAAVRQFWSVLEKVAWFINEAFNVGLSESDCSFAALFRRPSAKKRKALGLPLDAAFLPGLQCVNPGLRALAGLSCAFDAERASVYVPLKRLRHAVEHRVPDQQATRDDAAFLLGIARAAVLHGVDALVRQNAGADAR